MKPFHDFSINLGGRLLEINRPQVMAILNVTPDSFYAGSRVDTGDAIMQRALSLIADGADMIDIGAYSSRPGADEVSPDEETDRLCRGVEAVRAVAPDIPLSIDTFRASVARAGISAGADIVNDISGGDLDPDMFETVASLGVPYVVMHMRGTPATMQSMTDYDDVVAEVMRSLSGKINRLSLLGVSDVIADPGLGFGKTVGPNYQLLEATNLLADTLACPILIGASRKSMLTRPLGLTADEALNATTVVNTIALRLGASFIRVHDPREARQAVDLTMLMQQSLQLTTPNHP